MNPDELRDFLEDLSAGEWNPEQVAEFARETMDLPGLFRSMIQSEKLDRAGSKAPSKAERDRLKILAGLWSMDNTLHTHIQIQLNARFGAPEAGKPDALSQVMEVCRDSILDIERQVFDARYLCTFQLVAHCLKWEIPITDKKGAAFRELMTVIRGEVDPGWSADDKAAKLAIQIKEEHFP